MASGTPVIATNWSGPTAFLTPENGYPLPVHRLTPVQEGAFKGHLWADPDSADLAELLRLARSDVAGRLRRGERARIDMVSKFSPDKLAADVVAELERIRGGRGRQAENAPDL
mmetsp:Transcript_2560/g.9034  ORF Transcript_2560/g.9034 Transcript_2560/m.9034 type:complete len:113 (+) Transcript_2560:678-1016(+)